MYFVMSTRLPDDAWTSQATTAQAAVALPELQGPGLKVAGVPYGMKMGPLSGSKVSTGLYLPGGKSFCTCLQGEPVTNTTARHRSQLMSETF